MMRFQRSIGIPLLITIMVMAFIPHAMLGGSAQTPTLADCKEVGQVTVEQSKIIDLYATRSATGAEAELIVTVLVQYGQAVQAGDVEQIVSLITPEFDDAMNFSVCEHHLAPGSGGPAFDFTPMRVTTDDNGNWLAFIQRSYDDGSGESYRDVFMVIATEDAEGDLRIDFANGDVALTDGTTMTAESIYLEGLKP